MAQIVVFVFSVTLTLTFDLCSIVCHTHCAWWTGISMRSFIRIRPVILGDMPWTHTHTHTHIHTHTHTHTEGHSNSLTKCSTNNWTECYTTFHGKHHVLLFIFIIIIYLSLCDIRVTTIIHKISYWDWLIDDKREPASHRQPAPAPHHMCGAY